MLMLEYLIAATFEGLLKRQDSREVDTLEEGCHVGRKVDLRAHLTSHLLLVHVAKQGITRKIGKEQMK